MFSIYFLEPLTTVNYFFPLCDTESLEVFGEGEIFFPQLGKDSDEVFSPGVQTLAIEKSLSVFHNNYSSPHLPFHPQPSAIL